MSCRLCVTAVLLYKFFVADTYTQNALISKSINVTSIIGETIILNCSEYMDSQQYNISVFKWSKDGTPLLKTENYNSIRMSLENENKILRITSITIKDGGTYECATFNAFQSDYSIYTLTVEGLPNLETHQRSSSNETRHIGDSITWFCFQLHDKEEYIEQYTWLKDGKLLCVAECDKRLLLGDRNKSLRITNISYSDNGTYECLASNKFRIDSSVYALNVVELPNTSFDDCFVRNVTRYVSERVKWFCFSTKMRNVNNINSISHAWFKNNEPLRISKNDTSISLSSNNYTLKITSTYDNAGTYRCVTSNGLTTSSSNRTLTVLGEPEKSIYRGYTSNIRLMRGVSSQLSCNIFHRRNEYKTWFSWKKNGEPLIIADYNKTMHLSKNKDILVLINVTADEKGTYECEATNYYHKLYSNFILNVVDPKIPEIYNSSNSSTAVNVGESVQLFCYAQGMPPPTISWLKNGISLRVPANYDRVVLQEYKQKLLFISSKLEDNGTYQCNVSNILGSKVSNYSLSIKGIESKDYGEIFSHLMFLIIFLLLLVLIICYAMSLRIHQTPKLQVEDGYLRFENGDIDKWNPDLGIKEQAELLPYDKEWEFPRNKLKLGTQLGSGAFGVVYKADVIGLIDETTTTTVAVKTVKHNSEPCYTKALISELKILIHIGKHMNLVNLLGACTGDDNNKLMVIVEYCRFGSIREYLLKQRDCFVNQVTPNGLLNYDIKNIVENLHYEHEHNNGHLFEEYKTNNLQTNSDGSFIEVESAWYSNYPGDYSNVDSQPLCTHDLVYWSFQVARGMEYLASRKMYHGNLTIRNILLADDHIVKIGDYGLEKKPYSHETHRQSKSVPLSVKWMAIESLRDQIFSIISDVWSFGIVMWEIFSLAVTPYPSITSYGDLFDRLNTGYRMEQPKYANSQLYNIMLDCWTTDPTTRPTFNDLAGRIGDLLLNDAKSRYVNLNEDYVRTNPIKLPSSDYITIFTRPTNTNPRLSDNNSDLHQYNAKHLKKNDLELKQVVS